jgi:hypothetical protein
VHVNAPEDLHITLFHFSHPADVRTDTGCMHGAAGGSDSAQQQPAQCPQQQQQPSSTPLPTENPLSGPTQQHMVAEQAAAARVVAQHGCFQLQVSAWHGALHMHLVV